MRICFVGNDEHGKYAISSVVNKLSRPNEEQIDIRECFIAPDEKLTYMQTELIGHADDCYVFDISSFTDDEETIIRAVQNVRQATNSKTIIFAPGYMDDSRILNSFRALGINMIITEKKNLGNLQLQFNDFLVAEEKEDIQEQEQVMVHREAAEKQLLEDNPQLLKLNDLEDISALSATPVDEMYSFYQKKSKDTIRIAAVGSKRGIGTTTAAIQLVKYLNGVEPGTAAYLEYNQTGYMDNLQKTYIVENENQELESFVFKNVELYKNPRKLTLIPKYDYLIYDYGSVEDIIDMSSVYEKDYILLIGGAKPNSNEIGKMTMAMRLVYDQKNVFYLFNFIHEQEKEDVLEAQEDLRKKTFFLGYTPSPFILNAENSGMFYKILTMPEAEPEIEKSHKILKRIFPKGGV